MANLNVSVILGLVDRLSDPLRGVTGAFDRLRENIDRIGAMSANATFIGGALKQAGSQITGPLQEAVGLAMQVQSGLTEVGLVAGKTAAEVGAIRPELRALAAEYGKPQLELLSTLGSMTAKGLSFDQSAAALPEVARAAAALGAELADMEGAASAVIQQLKIDPAQLSDPFNRMAASANAGGFEVRDMAQYFPQLAASMAKLDTGADAVGTLAAALQVVRAGAGSGGEAATQMGDMLEKMFAPSTVQALEKKFGVDLPAAMQQWRAEGKDVFDEFIGLIQQVTGGDAFQVAQIYGDKEGRAGLLSLMRNWEDFQRIRRENAAAPAGDLVGQMGEQRLAEDPALRMARMSEAAANLRERIGTALLPVIERLVPRIERLVETLGAWADRNPELVATLASVAAGLGAFMIVGGGVITALAGIVGGLAIMSLSLKALGVGSLLAPLRAIPAPAGSAAVGLRGMALSLMLVQGGPLTKVLFLVRAIGASLLANPVGLFVAALVGAALLIRKYWEPISGFFRGLWAGLTEGLAPIAGAFSAAFAPLMPIIQPVLDGLAWLWDKITGLLTPVEDVGGAAEAMGRRWGEAIAGMILKVRELLEAFLGLASDAVQIGIDIVSGVWKGMQEKWGAMSAWLAEKTGGLLGTAKKAVDAHSPSRKFLKLGSDIVRGLQIGMESLAPGALATVRGLATGLAAVPLALAPVTAAAIPPSLAQITSAAGGVTAASGLSLDDPASQARDALRAGWLEEARARAGSVSSRPPGPAGVGASPKSGARGGVQMPISISVQAPAGADAAALGEMIAQRVREAAGDAARQLSALYDDPDEV